MRILSATHKNLGELVDDGRFRHDLYYRINVIELRVPPLRERRGDLPQLTTAILARLAGNHGRSVVPQLTPAALEALASHPFPGNVRELENVLERALAMADDDRIDAADLHLPAADGKRYSMDTRAPALRPKARPRWISTRPAVRFPPTSRTWNAPLSRRRWKTTARTRPRPPPNSASPSARCVTS